MVSVEGIIWYLVLLDSLFSNWIAYFGGKWYKKQGHWSKILPVTKAWAAWYLVLVLWVGWGLLRLGVL